eukprot:6368002-Amphidinium_carterae.1
MQTLAVAVVMHPSKQMETFLVPGGLVLPGVGCLVVALWLLRQVEMSCRRQVTLAEGAGCGTAALFSASL